MPAIAPLKVQVVAQTQFTPPADVPWETDADGGQALAEFAGRACYQSWDKPNAATATNAAYLRHIIEVGHQSVQGEVDIDRLLVAAALADELALMADWLELDAVAVSDRGDLSAGLAQAADGALLHGGTHHQPP